MKRMIVGLFLLVGLMVMSACGGSATTAEPAAAEVATAAEPSVAEPTAAAPTEAMTEPTAELTAMTEPTSEPTSTVEPTVKPTKEPPPPVTLELLADMFTQFDDRAGGNNWLLFNADGTWVARHGPTFDTGVAVAEGTFTLEGDVLTIAFPEGCPDGERYTLRFATAAAAQLHFEGLDSACDPEATFAEDFRRLPNWKRVES